jgi:hypothetical protein
MSNPTTIKYDWDEALAHLQLLGHQGVGVTKISAFRAKPQEGLRYIGVFEPTKYQLAIEQMRELNRQHPTLSFFVGFNALFESALEFAPNRFVVSSVHPKEPDVITTTNMVLDIDPVSERNESSSEEREAVLTVANNILDTEPLLAEASLIDSGHGAYVLVRLPAGDYDWDAVKAFCGELKVRYFSNPAIAGKAELELPGRSKFIGLAGTVNTKWDESIWRPRRLLHQGGVCTTLAEHLHAWQPPVQQGPAEKIEIGNLGPLDERIADWCPGYQEILHTKAAKGKRSDAAFALALKMDRDGWSWDEIETTLRSWGRMVFSGGPDANRTDRILDGLQEKLHDPKYAKVVPSHKFVRDILDSCPCSGNCDVDLAIQLGRTSALGEVNWKGFKRRDGGFLTTVGPQLNGAREDLTHFTGVHLARTLGNPDLVFQSAGAPGIGKTYRILRQCAFLPAAIFTTRREEFPKILSDLQSNLLPQELADAQRIAAQAGVEPPYKRPDVLVIDPRDVACEEPGCKAAIDGLKESGHAGLVESRVCMKCPRYTNRFDGCRYYRQFNLRPYTTIVAATAWLHLPQLPQLISQAKVVIIDEDFLDHVFERVTIGHQNLQNAIRFVHHHLPEYAGQLEPILEALAKATLPDTVTAFRNQRAANLARSINLKTFSQHYYEIVGQLPPETLPSLPLTNILSALKEKPNKLTQMLVVGRDVLTWRKLHKFTSKLPVVVLDATGPERLYRPIFPRRQIEVDEANAQMVAQVWQISDEKLPNQSFLSGTKTDQVKTIIETLYKNRANLGDDGFAVIGRENVVKALHLPTQIKPGYYWKVRGSRAFEGCHTLVLVGAAEPDFVDVGLQADLLFGRELPRTPIEQTRPYYLKSRPGMSWATKVEVYADPDLKAFHERLREGEMTQAAFRIRPLQGPHKLIVVLSNLPLQGLPPTELMSMNDLEARLGIKEPAITQRVLLTRKGLCAQLGREPTQDQIAKAVGVGRRFVGKILGSLTFRER